MKLQAKFTLNFVLFTLITLIVSFFLINWSVESQFHRLIQEKNLEWRSYINRDSSIIINPFDPIFGKKNITPEKRFLNTVKNSLFVAAFINITLAIIFAYFLSDVLLKRISKLKSSMHQYMKDGTNKPILHESYDEVDDLASIYNLLIEKIKKEEKIRREFFIDMSHELRTPLTAVKGYLEGLVDKVFDHEKQDNIHKKALKETDRMIQLISEMTTLAKLETGKMQLSKKTINLKDLTIEIIEMFAKETEENLQKIETTGNAKVEVDSQKIKQVLINLIDNAVHYGKKGTTIDIEIGENETGIYWKIKNQTEKIQEEDLEYFFERFYRADKSRSYNSKKTHLGIGLNIAQKIVEAHEGKISVNLEDENIVFEILLPKKT